VVQLLVAVPHHLDGDIKDDRDAHIGDPAVLADQPGDEGRGEAHQRDRQDKAEDQDARMLARGTRDRRARCRATWTRRRRGSAWRPAEGLARHARGDGAVGIEVGASERLRGGLFLDLVARAELAPHLPGDPRSRRPPAIRSAPPKPRSQVVISAKAMRITVAR
jgi:hypothetical protein